MAGDRQHTDNEAEHILQHTPEAEQNHDDHGDEEWEDEDEDDDDDEEDWETESSESEDGIDDPGQTPVQRPALQELMRVAERTNALLM